MKRFLFIVLALFVFSCKKEGDKSAKISSENNSKFKEQLQVTSNRKVTLLPDAREEVSQWLAYATAQNEIESLRTSTGLEILDTANNLMQIMESLKTSIPENLKTTAVNSRTNVLFTKAQILNQLANKKEKNADELFKVANELIVEFDNFKLQLNELFLKGPGDFELELDEEFEKAKEDALQEQKKKTISRERIGQRSIK